MKFVLPSAGGGGGDNVGCGFASARDAGILVFAFWRPDGSSPVSEGHNTSDAIEQPPSKELIARIITQFFVIFVRVLRRAMIKALPPVIYFSAARY